MINHDTLKAYCRHNLTQRLIWGTLAIASLTVWVGELSAGFIYSDFSDVSGLTINGDAAQVGSELRISSSSSFTAGSVFTTSAIPLGNLNSFSTYFQFRISNSGGLSDSDGQGADGIVFVVQAVNNNVGTAGGGIGYLGIDSSIGVEFDTWDNRATFGDPNGNHVAVNTLGTLGTPLATVVEPIRFNNGGIWNAWVDYDGVFNRFEVRWSSSVLRPVTAQIEVNANINTLLGSTDAYLGFTSATGSAFNDHDILNWEFRDSYAPIGISPVSVPEPGALVVWSLSSVLLCTISRKKKCMPRSISALL